MKLSFLVAFISIVIICYCELTNQYPYLIRVENEVDESYIKKVRELWNYESRTKVQQMQLDRKKRFTNQSGVETAYRVADSFESGNLTDSANTSTVNKHALLLANFKRVWPVTLWKQYGFFSDDYLDLINEHWLQFPPPSESLQKFLGGFYVLFTTIGCGGNIIVLLMYLSFVRLKIAKQRRFLFLQYTALKIIPLWESLEISRARRIVPHPYWDTFRLSETHRQHFVSETIVNGCVLLIYRHTKTSPQNNVNSMFSILVIALVAVSNIVYCMNVDTTTRVMDKSYIVQLQSDKNKCIYCKITKIVALKPFKCHNDFLWRCLDDLKQWKRRRRSSDHFKNELNDASGKLKVTDGAANEWASYQNSVDIVETTALSVSDIKVALVAKFIEKWPVERWRSLGLFTDEYLLRINSHWLEFPPPDSWIQYTFGSTYILLAGTGAFGNVLVLLMYMRCRTLRTPGNILVANLALSDFLMLAKTPIFIFNSFNLGPALGKTGCVIYGFVGGLTGTTSIATLSAIALDRYWAVVRPLEPLRALTAIRARLLAIGAWLYACIFAIIPALNIGYGSYVPEGYLTSCSFDYLTEDFSPRCFIFVFFCAAWLAPFCTITFCYISIFRVVVCNTSMSYGNQDQRLSSRHVKERTKRKAEIKLAFLVMAVIALFFISWTPYAVVALLGITGRKDLLTPITSMIPALFCKTAACINPFIYIITHPKFRKEFKKMLYRDKSKRMRGTFKTTDYCTDTTRMHRPSKDLSDTDVEIVEMKDIPYQTDEKRDVKVKTISSRVAERQDSQTSMQTIKSLEESIVSPPSWYMKPQFNKKRSFHRRSTRTNLSQTSEQDPTI